jgi:plastocyanin
VRWLAAAVAVLAFPASASAATVNVRASGVNFSPPSLTIAPGDTVKWTNDGGQHNVHFEDGQFQQPMSPSTVWPDPVQRTFASEGRFAYFCDQHKDFGMTGVITVKAGVAAPTVSPPPKVTALKAKRARGGRIKVTLRGAAGSTARVTLARRAKGHFRKVKTVRRKLASGRASVTFKGRRGKALTKGRYQVSAQLTAADGTKGPARRTKIRLR